MVDLGALLQQQSHHLIVSSISRSSQSRILMLLYDTQARQRRRLNQSFDPHVYVCHRGKVSRNQNEYGDV